MLTFFLTFAAAISLSVMVRALFVIEYHHFGWGFVQFALGCTTLCLVIYTVQS